MDAQLQDLLRAHEADPSDVAAARRYDAALRRAGRDAEVEARLLDKFLCPVLWEQMPPGADEHVRRCPRCEAPVGVSNAWGEDAVTLEEQASAGLPFTFGPVAPTIQRARAALLEADRHTAHEPSPGRAHLTLVTGPLLGQDVMERARDFAPELERHGLWVLPLGFREGYRFSRRAVFETTIDETLAAFLPFAQRLVPPGRQPVFVLETMLSYLLPEPPRTPAEHVLGWVGVGEGGALFVTREGEMLTPTAADVERLLAERSRSEDR